MTTPSPSGAVAAPEVAVTISPSAIRILVGKAAEFTAVVSGATNGAVTWAVQEGVAGGAIVAGQYTAPESPGVFHVVATSVADSTKVATATIEVEAFEMTVDLNVLDHLGINLYSNIAAVLTEAVANAWDADAENVTIRVDAAKQEWIEIVDDGIGMSVADLNGKYLRVGYRRRDDADDEHGKLTAKKRPVMGRKGLGKLSLFSIAEHIEVQSAQDGKKAAGFTMRVDGIKHAATENKRYHPVPLPDAKLTVTKGTRIVLREIKRQRLTSGVDALRKRLSRRFSVIGESYGFRITIDDQAITAADRGDLPKAQFLWTFKGHELDPATVAHVKERASVDASLPGWDPTWGIRGWIGTAAKPKDLDSDEVGNLNGIVVFARGRLIHENVLDRLNDGRLYTKYLTGQIEADFLDTDDKPDIATSDRQRLQEDDARYVALITFLRETLNEIEKKWNEWRRKHEVEKAKAQSPALKEWLDGLAEGHKQSAETMLAKVSSLPVEEEENRKLLFKHAIFAFERMKLRGSTEEFAQHAIENVELLFRLLADRDALEASLYRDIVKSRLEAIRAFQKIVDEDAKERVLQQYLFKHLWLLDPAWDRATGTEVMESALLEEAGVVNDLTEKEKAGRVDIKYQTTAGKHVVVELKKVGRKMKLLELQEQGSTYVDKIKKILKAKGEESPNIEVVFVIGQPIDEANNVDRVKASMEAVSKGSRIVLYDQLIDGARKAYAEYLQKSYELDKLEKLVGSL